MKEMQRRVIIIIYCLQIYVKAMLDGAVWSGQNPGSGLAARNKVSAHVCRRSPRATKHNRHYAETIEHKSLKS
jgi:hypothetical protein